MGDIVYVVRRKSRRIKTYSADTLSPLGEGIHVEGMKHPMDIVACHRDRQLYVADHNYCIWRLSDNGHEPVRWLDTKHVEKLSLTSQGLLVTSSSDTLIRRQYNTANAQVMTVVQCPWDVAGCPGVRHVTLPQYMKRLCHAVETTNGSFVISHEGRSEDDWHHAVSERLRFNK